MTLNGPSQVTLLPSQMGCLASIAERVSGAIGISQSGNIIHVDTGQQQFKIDAQGRIVNHNMDQESLC